MTTVSIIMPNYNCAEYIGVAIESVLAQTYADWELIIADDNSTDGSRKIIEEYARKDSRIIPLLSKDRQGPSTRRNDAIRRASGEYIAFLDSDDLWYPDKLRIQIEYMRSNSVDICCARFDVMNDEGKKIYTVIPPDHPINYELLLKGRRVETLTVVVKRLLLPAPNAFSAVFHEDLTMWLDILKRGHLVYTLQQPLACYRLRKGSLSSSKLRSAYEFWKVLRRQERFNLQQSIKYFSYYALTMFKKYGRILPYVLRWR